MRIKSLIALVLIAFTSLANAQTGTPKPKSTLQSLISTCFPDQFTGAITPAVQRSCLSDFLASWQQYASVNAQVGVTYTIQSSDYGQLITFTNAAPVAVTLPQAAGTFSSFNTYISNLGAGLVTVTPAGSTINGAASFSVTQNQAVWIVSDGTNYQVWRGFGSGVVNTGTANQLAYYASSAAAVSGNPFLSAASGVLTQNLNAAAAPAQLSGTQFQMVGVDATANRQQMDSFGAASLLSFRRADGTNAAPPTLTTNDPIGGLSWHGYRTTGGYTTNSVAALSGFAEATWTNTSAPTYLTFATTPVGSLTAAEIYRITSAGTVQPGTTATYDFGTTGLRWNNGWFTTMNLTNPISPANGGTGLNTLTAHNILVGNGISTVNSITPSATVGIPVISQGATSDPVYGTAIVAGGGTGITAGISGGVPFFSSTSTISTSNALTQFGPVYGGGAGSAPTAAAVGTNGQVLTGNTGAAPSMQDTGQIFRWSATGLTGTTVYMFYQGGGATTESTVNSNIFGPFPFKAIIKNLYVISDNAPGVGKTGTFTLRTGASIAALADTALTAQLSGGAQVTANDTTHSATVNAGDVFTMKAVADAGSATMAVSVSVQIMKSP